MRLFLFLSLFILNVQVLAQSAPVKKFVIIGDSLTEGYGVSQEAAFPALLEKKINNELKKSYKIVNSGISGSTTASAPQRAKWILKQKPDLVMLILGANDGLRGLKLEASEKNLSTAIEEFQKANIKIILGGLYMPPNYGAEYTENFKKMYSRLAKKYKMKLVPFILDKVAGDPKFNLPDGIHPNEEGHKIIAQTIFDSIKEGL